MQRHGHWVIVRIARDTKMNRVLDYIALHGGQLTHISGHVQVGYSHLQRVHWRKWTAHRRELVQSNR
eukprot:m.1541343 g.1541343  ORF g.1541343 m.1541343 type:complete len:67 (-) comp25249_c0_seq60:2506-2706(-)